MLLVLPKSVSLVSGQTGDKTGARGLLVVNKTHTLPVMMINMSPTFQRKHTHSPLPATVSGIFN